MSYQEIAELNLILGYFRTCYDMDCLYRGSCRLVGLAAEHCNVWGPNSRDLIVVAIRGSILNSLNILESNIEKKISIFNFFEQDSIKVYHMLRINTTQVKFILKLDSRLDGKKLDARLVNDKLDDRLDGKTDKKLNVKILVGGKILDGRQDDRRDDRIIVDSGVLDGRPDNRRDDRRDRRQNGRDDDNEERTKMNIDYDQILIEYLHQIEIRKQEIEIQEQLRLSELQLQKYLKECQYLYEESESMRLKGDRARREVDRLENYRESLVVDDETLSASIQQSIGILYDIAVANGLEFRP